MRWKEIVEGDLDMANAEKKPLTERYDPAFVQKLKEAASATPVASFDNPNDALAYLKGWTEKAQAKKAE